MLGKNGEKMDEELKEAFQEGGEKALIPLLLTRYKAEHS